MVEFEDESSEQDLQMNRLHVEYSDQQEHAFSLRVILIKKLHVIL
jgi:hypothetical protein